MDMFTQVHLTYLKVTSVCEVLLFEIFMDWHKKIFMHKQTFFYTAKNE